MRHAPRQDPVDGFEMHGIESCRTENALDATQGPAPCWPAKGTSTMTQLLVTGATGKVGSQTLQHLLERGTAPSCLRAGVRDPAKAQSLAEAGVEVVRYDHDEPDTLAAAFDGVDRAFVLVPFVPDFAKLGAQAIEAARAAGAKHIVKLSAAGADARSDFWLAKNHGQSDEDVANSGLGYTILRPTFFQDNVLTFSADSLKSQRTFYGASGDQPVAYISSRDIAAVAAEVLLHPEVHAGMTHDLTGGEALKNSELAALLGQVIGEPVTYTDLSLDQYADGARRNGTPELFVEAFTGLENMKAQGWAAAVSPHVQQVLGRAPETYAAFLKRNATRLR